MDWKRGPPVLVGEKVLWLGSPRDKSETGIIKWIGNIPEISPDWCVGIELDIALPNLGCEGFWKNRRLFECRSAHGLLAPMEEIKKISSKTQFRPISAENYSDFILDDTQFRGFTRSDFWHKKNKKIELRKNRHSYSESNQTEDCISNQIRETKLYDKKEIRKSVSEVLSDAGISRESFKLEKRDIKNVQREKNSGKNSQQSANALNINLKVNEALENSHPFNSKLYIKSMNEIAGYFKEIKEGDEKLEKQQTDNFARHDSNRGSHSKPKKLFSFLKWFNKKHKNEPNFKVFKESSAASSPMFSRKETSSCESIDTLFSTQTVRSFAYIPPTQYVPSAPPLDYDKSSYENIFKDFSSQKNTSEETEFIYDKRKKRKAPAPPRLSRENSLPTTLEYKKNDEENFDGIKTYHRRTVSESFKDKKAGAYCHVQGKRKAPQPPVVPLYPNLQKINNQYSSLHKKKKPAPPPPELHSENQSSTAAHQLRKDVQKEKENKQPNDEAKKHLKGNENNKMEEKEVKVSQTYKDTLIKDASLSPLPSRPWYKRTHRDSTGSNITRKDLLKAFDKKKNKETDDWMPEVGFSRRSLSTESGHNKFNIFSKLEKTEDKKKEEKRKSQISILTNISELDREAAEIVRKEQAEEKKLIAAHDAKYYLSKENNDKIHKFLITTTNPAEILKNNSKASIDQNKPAPDKMENEPNGQVESKFNEAQPVLKTSDELKESKEQTLKDESSKTEDKKLKDTENDLNPHSQSNENAKQNSFLPNVLGDLISPSNSSSITKIHPKPSQTSSQARLNYFNVQNKQLNYMNEPWVCQKCTLENPGWRIFCEICSSVKSTFTFDDTLQKMENRAVEPKPVSMNAEKQKELNVVSKASNQNTTQTCQTVENEKNKGEKSTEILDELRKKRMKFFISKLESLSESDKSEFKSPQNDSEKTDLKKILKEMKDSISKDTLEKNDRKINGKSEENNSTEELERDLNEENFKKNDSISNANAINTTVVEQKEDKMEKPKQPNSSNILKGKSQLNITGTSKLEVAQNGQTQTENHPKVVEAYVVTKTIVMEDIIVKKPERGRKVSSSVQTKSSLSPFPTAEVIRPPPRTKKIAFESINEINKETETQSHSENGFQKKGENLKEDLEELSRKLTQAEGLADFRANIESMPPNTEMNTVAVNRLLRKLEMAINCGDHFVAAGLAKELALMKINCCVTRQTTSSPSTSKITIDLYIEDKISHQGPIPLKVSPTMSLLQLKKKVQQEFGIPLDVQRWILDKKLVNDDNKTLEAEGIRNDKCPLFLYLIVPGDRKTHNEALKKSEKKSESTQSQDSKRTKESSSNLKNKGWYFKYEEDHYSYCEDSEDESNDTDSNGKNKEESTTKISDNDQKKTETEQKVKNPEKPLAFDLKSRDAENNIEKELKFISVNSVKQKIEKLNKTFAENTVAVKPPLRSSRSPETWKCESCNIVNLPGRLNCLSCNTKKAVIETNNTNTDNEKRLYKAKPLKKDHIKLPEKLDDNIHYKALMELQDADLVPNSEPFNCPICMIDYALGEGVTLKDCLHTFCRTCLISTVQYSEDAEVKCPYLDETYSCSSVLQEREIKALVPQKIYELHLAKSVKEAENKIENAFHCKTPDCKGWCIYEDNVNEFRCPVCRSINCLTCQAIHTGINCREYQERVKDASETDMDAKKTREMLNEMVEKGEAMACPKCQVVLMKKWGCDWLRCSVCKTEICWVTRGFRWGPEGKGDTSGGCKCGINGVKCHPKCNYCH